jgi:hypothetical protein
MLTESVRNDDDLMSIGARIGCKIKFLRLFW